MLVGGTTFAQLRIAYLLGWVAVACLPVLAWWEAARLDLVDWPSGSTRIGMLLGFAGAAIIAFEMLLWPRKQFRRFRLGRTRRWMYWHIWLGLVSLPLAVSHAGFQFGGLLTTVVLVLFLLVIASGIWGLSLQQVLPHRLLDAFPYETIEGEMDVVMRHERTCAGELVAANTVPRDPLRAFFEEQVDPYLSDGKASASPLRSASRANAIFNDFALRQPSASGLLDQLRRSCDARRQYDQQARIHRWLHNWLCIHVPLSVALCILLAVHIVTALEVLVTSCRARPQIAIAEKSFEANRHYFHKPSPVIVWRTRLTAIALLLGLGWIGLYLVKRDRVYSDASHGPVRGPMPPGMIGAKPATFPMANPDANSPD